MKRYKVIKRFKSAGDYRRRLLKLFTHHAKTYVPLTASNCLQIQEDPYLQLGIILAKKFNNDMSLFLWCLRLEVVERCKPHTPRWQRNALLQSWTEPHMDEILTVGILRVLTDQPR